MLLSKFPADCRSRRARGLFLGRRRGGHPHSRHEDLVEGGNVSVHAVRLTDLTGTARYDRAGNDLVSQGLYLDLPPWGYHVFEVTTV